jgi:RNA polymerase sigma-70 factor (ECF subfamily)
MAIGAAFGSVLRAAQHGEGWAVGELYRALQPPLLAYVRARSPHDADDICGEVWLAVARSLPGFEGDEAAFRGWLFTIAHRQVVGGWRKRGRRRTDIVDPREIEAPSTDDTAAEAVERAGSQAAVDALVRGLSPDQAEVVLLRVVAGLDVAQVARITGKRPGTVRVLQHRALQRLRQLHGEGPGTGV